MVCPLVPFPLTLTGQCLSCHHVKKHRRCCHAAIPKGPRAAQDATCPQPSTVGPALGSSLVTEAAAARRLLLPLLRCPLSSLPSPRHARPLVLFCLLSRGWPFVGTANLRLRSTWSVAGQSQLGRHQALDFRLAWTMPTGPAAQSFSDLCQAPIPSSPPHPMAGILDANGSWRPGVWITKVFLQLSELSGFEERKTDFECTTTLSQRQACRLVQPSRLMEASQEDSSRTLSTQESPSA